MSVIFKENNRPIIAVVASCILFGMIGIFVREIKDMGPGSILFYRLYFGFAALLGYFIIVGEVKDLKFKQKRYYLLLLGVLNTVCTFAYFSAIKHIGIPVSVLLLYTAPIYVTFFSPFLLKERVTVRDTLALTLSISGILLAVNPTNLAGITVSGGFGNNNLGIIFGLLAGLCYGCTIMIVNYLKDVYSPVEQIFWSTSVSLVLLLPFGVSVSGPVLFENLKILIPLGIIATAFASLLYMRGVSRIKAQTAAVISLLEPVSSIVFCCMLLGEPMQPNTLGGCIFILAGAFFIAYETPRWPKLLDRFNGKWNAQKKEAQEEYNEEKCPQKNIIKRVWDKLFCSCILLRRGKL